MAKKKKQTRAKKLDKTTSVKSEPSIFWPLALAVVLCVLALFLLLGSFNTGGILPKGLFHAAYWTLGWSAFLTPIAFVYFGVYKFLSEDHRIPLGNLVSMLAVLIFGSSWLFTAFATHLASGSYSGGHGGMIGKGVGVAVLHVLDKFPASLVFFIFAVAAAFFAFGISGKALTKLGELFKKEETDDTDLAALKQKSNFQLNEGVPVEHHSAVVARTASFKNTVQNPSSENREALTLASDPDWKFPGMDLLNQKQDKADAGDVEANARDYP